MPGCAPRRTWRRTNPRQFLPRSRAGTAGGACRRAVRARGTSSRETKAAAWDDVDWDEDTLVITAPRPTRIVRCRSRRSWAASGPAPCDDRADLPRGAREPRAHPEGCVQEGRN